MLEPNEEVDIRHETAAAKNKNTQKISQKRTQSDGFLNRHEFAYAGRDTVNQLGKVAPRTIKSAISEINNIAQQRINQIINQGGKEVKRVLPKILRGAIEVVYQTSFFLIGKFSRQQLQKLKSKILRWAVLIIIFIYMKIKQ